jgi:predicted amidohydrolase
MTNKIALVQMVSSQQVDKNLPRADAMIREAAQSAGYIFLPENFAALAAPDPGLIGRQEAGAQPLIRPWLSGLAKELGCWIFAGTLPLASRPDGSAIKDGRVRAASLVFDPTGLEVARYDKIHMFDVEVADAQRSYRESATFECGDSLALVPTPLAKIGLSVCYDIRFPELYRQLFAQGAECLAIPSAFTTVTGEAHFEVLMRARAIENVAYTIAACQGGRHDSGRETHGQSMVVNPWGEVVVRAGRGEDILLADINLDEVARIRRDMPVLQQRRL